MGRTLTARVSDELGEALDEISREESLDKSAVARRLLEKAVEDYRREKAVEGYREGGMTLRKAAKIADMTLREFMSELKQRDVPIQYSIEDLEEDVKAVKNG